VFSELPSLPSAGSRSGCLSNSLGCEPTSLIRVSLGWFDYPKKCEDGRSKSGLFACKRSKAFSRRSLKSRWPRRVQAPMPQTSGPNLQEQHIIVTCKEEGAPFSQKKTAARRKLQMEHVTRLSNNAMYLVYNVALCLCSSIPV
jgi:hypothetical protein